MLHGKEFHYETEYVKTSTNQHGDRFKKGGCRRLSVDRLSSKMDNALNMSVLISLSDQLDTPVRWDVNAEEYYIELVSLEQLKKGN